MTLLILHLNLLLLIVELLDNLLLIVSFLAHQVCYLVVSLLVHVLVAVDAALVLHLRLQVLLLILVIIDVLLSKLVSIGIVVREVSGAVDFSQLVLDLLALSGEVLAHATFVVAALTEIEVLIVVLPIIVSIVIIRPSLLLLILLQNGERVGKLEGRLLHLQVENALVGVVVVGRVYDVNAGDAVLVVGV